MRKTPATLLFSLVFIAGISTAQQWSTPVRISQPGGGYYPQLISQGDTVHVLYENTYTYDKIRYVRSTDAGASWGEHTILSERRGATAYPHIIQWGPRLMALWRMYFSSGITRLNIGYAISEDNGVTWTPPNYIFSTNRDYIHTFGASCADSVINIVFYDDWGPDNALYSVRSTNFGQSWSQSRQILSIAECDIPDQVSINEIVHFAWAGRFTFDSTWEVYDLQSTNGGIDWFSNTDISEHDQVHSYWPAICANSPQEVKLCWFDYKDSPYIATGDIFLRASADSGSSWVPEQQITFNHLAQMSDIAQSGDTVAIVWEDIRSENGRGSIYCTISLNDGETWNDPDRLDSDTCGSINPSIAISNNRVYAIWQEGRFSQDSNGVYFSCWSEEPEAIGESANEALPNKIFHSAYPNPFNSATTIALTGAEKAEIGIYDITGRVITTLHAEHGRAVWDASGYSSGLYFARANGNATTTVKLVLVK